MHGALRFANLAACKYHHSELQWRKDGMFPAWITDRLYLGAGSLGASMSNRMERKDFSARLVAALKLRGYPPYATAVMRLYNNGSRRGNVTVNAVRKWLMGESIPTQEKIQTLSHILNIVPEWLRFGTGSMTTEEQPVSLNIEEMELVERYRRLHTPRRLALLNYLRRIA